MFQKRLKIKVPARAAATSAIPPTERFKDVDPDIDRKKNIISIESYEDKQFELKKLELDLGIQVRAFFCFFFFKIDKNMKFVGRTGVS